MGETVAFLLRLSNHMVEFRRVGSSPTAGFASRNLQVQFAKVFHLRLNSVKLSLSVNFLQELT